MQDGGMELSETKSPASIERSIRRQLAECYPVVLGGFACLFYPSHFFGYSVDTSSTDCLAIASTKKIFLWEQSNKKQRFNGFSHTPPQISGYLNEKLKQIVNINR